VLSIVQKKYIKKSPKIILNLPPVSTRQGELVAKFATGVIDTGGAPGLANISAYFRKNSK